MKKILLLFCSLNTLWLTGQMRSVTFQVDMSQQSVDTAGVHIAGSFQNWNPASSQMTLTTNNIYTFTTQISQGTTIQFKYINGNTWAGEEQVPSACGVSNGFGGYNRTLTITQDTVLPVVCFASCTACQALPPTKLVTFQVNMSNVPSVSPLGVRIAGNFQGWNPASTPLTQSGSVWSIAIALPVGQLIEYKFINGNAWGQDETVPTACGTGTPTNRFLTVPGNDTVLPAVCFGTCNTNCPVIPPAPKKAVTFRVDMSQVTVSPNGVHVAGNFQGWNPATTPMILDTITGAYTRLDSASVGDTIYYKFINGNAWGQDETVPTACGLGSPTPNRWFVMPNTDTTLPVVCFGMCGPCPVPQPRNVTFRVDMKNVPVSPNGVFLTGSFNNWSPTATPMTANGTIHSVTLVINAGTSVQYKFLNDSSFTAAEMVPPACGVSDGFGGFNRVLSIVKDTVLPAVCFSMCDTCPVQLPTSKVTLSVLTNGIQVSQQGMHVAGTFNGWNFLQHPMNPTGPDRYEITLDWPIGEQVLYRFSTTNSLVGQEFISGSCGFLGSRQLTVPANDTVLPDVCFERCDLVCTSFNVDEPMHEKPHARLNNGLLEISGLPGGGTPVTIRIIDVSGRSIYQTQFSSTGVWTDAIDLSAGVYLIQLYFDKKIHTLKVPVFIGR
ncbi:MAG: T9SS type A sorting domain-containing protein [Thermaurantimonas sp.]